MRKLETSAEPPALKYSTRKLFQFMHEIVSAMASSGYPELALKLFLQCAVAADRCDFKPIAYEFVSQVRPAAKEVAMTARRVEGKKSRAVRRRDCATVHMAELKTALLLFEGGSEDALRLC